MVTRDVCRTNPWTGNINYLSEFMFCSDETRSTFCNHLFSMRGSSGSIKLGHLGCIVGGTLSSKCVTTVLVEGLGSVDPFFFPELADGIFSFRGTKPGSSVLSSELSWTASTLPSPEVSSVALHPFRVDLRLFFFLCHPESVRALFWRDATRTDCVKQYSERCRKAFPPAW